jgi:hypothetical protein
MQFPNLSFHLIQCPGIHSQPREILLQVATQLSSLKSKLELTVVAVVTQLTIRGDQEIASHFGIGSMSSMMAALSIVSDPTMAIGLALAGQMTQ